MSDVPVSTRLATVADAPEIAQMLRDFNAEYGDDSPPLVTLEERLATLLAGERFWAVMAGIPAVGLGTVAQRPSPFYAGEVAYLEDLYVAPTLRGTGIGSALVELMFAECERRGVGLVEVGVDEPDVDAMRFYERHGFVYRDPETSDRAFYIYREL